MNRSVGYTGLEGKVAVITGGASGIGLGIARVLASHGCRLVLVQRNPRHFTAALAELGPDVKPLCIEADIQNREAVAKMIERTLAELGGIDILVNTASLTGKPAVAPFLECTPEQLDSIIDINLKGTFHVSQLAAREMAARGGGNIIHISSVGAYSGQELASAYCATKAAQVALAKTMALELAPHGIRVNAIAPGDIYTPANADIVQDLHATGATGKYLRVTPLGRRGTPEEIGHAAAFLASAEASFITGATLLVDGGLTAGTYRMSRELQGQAEEGNSAPMAKPPDAKTGNVPD
jgi:NAD(P)-dependent dehydrogenase (short-subunit alcohol dehydrogenase family)